MIDAEMECLLLMLSKGIETDKRKGALVEELKRAYPECLDEEGYWNEVPLPDLEMLTEDTAYPVPFHLYNDIARLLLDGMPEPEKSDTAKAMAEKMRKYCRTVDVDGESRVLCYRCLKDKARALLRVGLMPVDIFTAVRIGRLFHYGCYCPAPDARESLYMLNLLLGTREDILPMGREETLKELNQLLDKLEEKYIYCNRRLL